MNKTLSASILDHLEIYLNSRVEYLVEYKLIDTITIALCTVITGANNWTEVEQFGQ